MKNKSLLLCWVLLLCLCLIGCASTGNVDGEIAQEPAATAVPGESADTASEETQEVAETEEVESETADSATNQATVEPEAEAEPTASASNNSEEPMAAEMGIVDFPISCTAEAQAEFNHGLAALHSFWFPQLSKALPQSPS